MRFGFYINPLARLRDIQPVDEPDPVILASLAETAGSDVILAGWVPKGGLLVERDVRLIREVVRCDFSLVTPASDATIESVVKFRPDSVVLAAAAWDGIRHAKPTQPEVETAELTAVAVAYRSAGIPVFLLVEPDLNGLKAAARCGVAGVVFDCTSYSNALTDAEAESAINQLSDASMAAHKYGMIPAAGHGLNYRNIAPVAELRYIDEFYVGRAVAARAVINGIAPAVKEMIEVLHRNKERV